MPSDLIETYLARGSAGQRAALGERAASAAEELTTGERPVSYEGSIFLLEDEICFFVFVASSALDARSAAEHAALEPIRVLEAVSSDSNNP